MSDALIGFVGAIVGGVLTIAGAWAQAAYYRHKQTKALKVALVSEISALVALTVANRYEGHLRMAAELMRARSPLDRKGAVVIPAGEGFFSVYGGSVETLGQLKPDVAANVVAFYQWARSWVETLGPSTASEIYDLDPDDAADFYISMADRLVKLHNFAGEVCKSLGSGAELSSIVRAHQALSVDAA